MGFPSYCRLITRDWMARKAFEKSEVNTRVYKALTRWVAIRKASYLVYNVYTCIYIALWIHINLHDCNTQTLQVQRPNIVRSFGKDLSL